MTAPRVVPNPRETLKRLVAKQRREELENRLASQLNAVGIRFDQQVRLVTGSARKWDFSMPQVMLCIEVQGGIYTNGKHTHGKGYEDDVDKAWSAAMLGWTPLYATGNDIKSGLALSRIEMFIVHRSAAGRVQPIPDLHRCLACDPPLDLETDEDRIAHQRENAHRKAMEI